MRKITRQACQAFENGENFKASNTTVTIDENGKYMHLWGHCIARQLNGNTNSLEINLCGYNTVTTRERLNGLWGVNIHNKNFTPYLNGNEIPTNEWVKVGLRLGV